MLAKLIPMLLFALSESLAAADALPVPTASRGELLYSTHCIACHTDQVHWRDKKSVTDWSSLRAEVRRWQESAQLGWNEADIDEVARYLQARYYRQLSPS